MAKPTKTVPIPFTRRIKTWRQRFLPIVVWSASIALAFVLYDRQSQHIDAVGLVQAHQVIVAPLEDGALEGLHVALLDEVQAGDIVALMDDRLIEAELEVAEAELRRLRTELDAGRTTLALDQADREENKFSAHRRLLVDSEEAELDLLILQARHESNKVELQRLELVRDRQLGLVRSDILDMLVYEESELRRAALDKEIAQTEVALDFARARLEILQRRSLEFSGMQVDVAVEEILAPLQEGVAVQNARIMEVQARREQRILRAPISGIVESIFHQSGDVVLAGTPLLAIASPRAHTIVAYLDESQARDVAVDTIVQVHSRKAPAQIHLARVQRVGATIAELPVHARKNQAIAEWGLQLLIGEIPERAFFPGEVVDLRLLIN